MNAEVDETKEKPNEPLYYDYEENPNELCKEIKMKSQKKEAEVEVRRKKQHQRCR